jgi:hypothetical protein
LLTFLNGDTTGLNSVNTHDTLLSIYYLQAIATRTVSRGAFQAGKKLA